MPEYTSTDLTVSVDRWDEGQRAWIVISTEAGVSSFARDTLLCRVQANGDLVKIGHWGRPRNLWHWVLFDQPRVLIKGFGGTGEWVNEIRCRGEFHENRLLAAPGGTITTPAGLFEKTLKVEIRGGGESLWNSTGACYSGSDYPGRVIYEYFAEGVGVVRTEWEDPGDPIEKIYSGWELVRYRVPRPE
jgi:hypothetical protein